MYIRSMEKPVKCLFAHRSELNHSVRGRREDDTTSFSPIQKEHALQNRPGEFSTPAQGQQSHKFLIQVNR